MKIDWGKILLWGAFIFYLTFLLLRQEAAINQDLGRHLRLGEIILGEGKDARNCALYKNCLTYTHPDYPFVNHHWGSEVIFYLIYKLGGFGGLIILKAIVLGMVFLITARHIIDASLRGMSRRMTRQSSLPAMPAGRQAGKAGESATNNAVLNLSSKIPQDDGDRNVLFVIISSFVVIFLSIQMIADRLTTRPEIFGYLLFSSLFWRLDRKHLGAWGMWGVWGIMLLWVNLHISFVFGLILVWIWTISKLTSQGLSLPGKESPFKALLIKKSQKTNFMRPDLPSVQPTFKVGHLVIAIISTLITLINPNGIKGALAPLNIFKEYGYTIAENMTPFFMAQFKPQLEYWIYGGLLAATVTIWGIRGFRGIGGFESIALIAFSVFPLIAVRHLPFFGLMMPVVLTPLLLDLFQKVPYLCKVRYLSEYMVGGLILLAFVNPVPLAYAKLSPAGLDADKRHEAAILFVKENNLQGNMWNNYDIGSYLEWTLPEYKTFVDGRPEAFPVEFFRDVYKPMQEKPEIWDQETEKYGVQWVFAALTDTTPWFQQWWMMIQIHPKWKLVYVDDYTAILVKKDGINGQIEATGRAKTMEILKNF